MNFSYKNVDPYFWKPFEKIDTFSGLNGCFQILFENIGIERFALTELVRDGGSESPEVNIFSTYPSDWLNQYSIGDYYEYDPVYQDPIRAPLPFYWDSKSFKEMTNQQKQLLIDAHDFGVRNGTTIPLRPTIHKNGYLTILDANLIEYFDLMFFLRVAGDAYFKLRNKILGSDNLQISGKGLPNVYI